MVVPQAQSSPQSSAQCSQSVPHSESWSSQTATPAPVDKPFIVYGES